MWYVGCSVNADIIESKPKGKREWREDGEREDRWEIGMDMVDEPICVHNIF